jgi:hypothetical protein
MLPSLTETLRDWRDFYLLAGTASATLVGLMFVAASIGASVFNEKHVAPMRAFVTPTVVHFSSVFFASLVLVMPGHSGASLGGLLGLGGLAGVAYCGAVLARILRGFTATVDWEDRIFYALLPGFGYLALVGAAAMAVAQRPAGAAGSIAAAFIILLAAGLRNAWDMMVWLSVRAPSPAAALTETDGEP